MESKIVLENIEKSYGKEAPVIEGLNLEIGEGSFTVLLGPSGCGKSTTLRMIAGLEEETGGTLYIDGKDMKEVKPGDRDIAMVFQNYALYPTMTVRENIEFGLKNAGVAKKEREERICEVSRSVGLEEYLNRKPSALSGGQRQRVALARAVLMKTDILFLDEFSSGIDLETLSKIENRLLQTSKLIIYITHVDTDRINQQFDEIIDLNEFIDL